jgi:plastocyanin
MKRFVSQYSQRFRPLWVILTVIVVMSLALVAWGGSATTAVASTKVLSLGQRSRVVHTVKIMEKNGRFFFQPSRMTIKVGDVVVWKNVTVVPHTVTSDTGVFNTHGFLSPNVTFTFTFNRAGTFKYHCNIHLYMHAAIIVKSALPGNHRNPTSPPPSMPTPTPPSGGGGSGGGYGGGGGMGGGGGY